MPNKIFNFGVIALTAVFSIAFFSLFGAEAYDGMLSAAVSRMPSCSNSILKIIPDGGTRVRIPDATGKILNFDTGVEITGLTPDLKANKIYYSVTKEVGIIYAPYDCYPKFGYVFLAQIVANPVVAPPAEPSPLADIPSTDSTAPVEKKPVDTSISNTLPVDSTPPTEKKLTDSILPDPKFPVENLPAQVDKKPTETQPVGDRSISVTPPVDVTKLFIDVEEDHPYYSAIMKIIIPMLQKYTYKWPANDKFGPNIKTTATFAAQILGAVADTGCGSDKKYPGRNACKAFLLEKGIIDDKFPTAGINRFTFYKYLLKAKAIPLEEVSILDEMAVCSDQGRWSAEMAQVFATARKYGFGALYAGQKCYLLKSFSRKQAASFAVKFLRYLKENPPKQQ